jgi:hypothetical protein
MAPGALIGLDGCAFFAQPLNDCSEAWVWNLVVALQSIRDCSVPLLKRSPLEQVHHLATQEGELLPVRLRSAHRVLCSMTAQQHPAQQHNTQPDEAHDGTVVDVQPKPN